MAADWDVGPKVTLGLITRVGRYLFRGNTLNAETSYNLGDRLSFNHDQQDIAGTDASVDRFNTTEMSLQSEPFTDDAHLALRNALGQRRDEAAGVDARGPAIKQRDGPERRTRDEKDVSDMTNTDTAKFTMYTTPWCGYCKRLKSQLAREGITGGEVNIEEHPESAELVMRVNGGNQTVPTLVFSDGAAMTNPSAAQVKKKLAELA